MFALMESLNLIFYVFFRKTVRISRITRSRLVSKPFIPPGLLLWSCLLSVTTYKRGSQFIPLTSKENCHPRLIAISIHYNRVSTSITKEHHPMILWLQMNHLCVIFRLDMTILLVYKTIQPEGCFVAQADFLLKLDVNIKFF